MAKSFRKYLSYAIIALISIFLLFAVIVFVSTAPSSTIDKRIAEFEAKRKIPDSENAAVIYYKLFENPDRNPLELASNYFRDPNLRKPWSGKDNPQSAKWLKTQQGIMSELLKASKFEKCYFPTTFEPNSFSKHIGNNSILRSGAVMLIIAANNDIAEGRLDGAIEKSQCILKLAQHICQQPLWVDYFVGIAIEQLSLSKLKNIILESEITEQQLNSIKAFPVETKDTWKNQLPQLLEAQKLLNEKLKENLTFFQRIQMSFDLMQVEFRMTGRLFDTTDKTTHKLYLRLLVDRRGNRILIALRHYKNQNNQWPESLEQIKSFVDPNVLVDPMNNGSFVYKKTEDNFTLYSKGLNNIDEGGKWNVPADDWPIWPKP